MIRLNRFVLKCLSIPIRPGLIIVLLVGLSAIQPGRVAHAATVIVSNLNKTTGPSYQAGGSTWIAQAFTTGASPYQLNSVVIKIQSGAAGASLKLYGSSSGNVGSFISNFGAGALESGENYRFVPSGSVSLAASTTYWIVMSSGSATFWYSTMDQTYTGPGTIPTDKCAADSYDSGATWEAYYPISDGPYMFEVRGSAVTFTNGANAALNFTQNNAIPLQNNWLLGQFSLAGTEAGATLNSVIVSLAGTYDPGDLASNPFQLYASNTNNFGSATAIGTSASDPGSGHDVTFSSLSDAIPSGTRYYWVTADISATATADDKIDGTISDAGDLSMTSGTLGPSNYGKLNAGTDASLPVGLVSFSARSGGRFVILNWITESETENLGFILERSEGNVWTRIASYLTRDELKGQGNTSSRTEYSFTDENVQSGREYFYRLSDVSTMGEITAYASVSIKMDDLPETTKMANAYPNPFNPQTDIVYQLSEDADVNITVFDMMGRRVKTLFEGRQLAGSHHVYWNGTTEGRLKAPSGSYMIRMQTDDAAQVQKVVLMK